LAKISALEDGAKSILEGAVAIANSLAAIKVNSIVTDPVTEQNIVPGLPTQVADESNTALDKYAHVTNGNKNTVFGHSIYAMSGRSNITLSQGIPVTADIGNVAIDPWSYVNTGSCNVMPGRINRIADVNSIAGGVGANVMLGDRNTALDINSSLDFDIDNDEQQE